MFSKVKLFLCTPWRDIGDCVGLASPILNFGTRLWWLINFTTQLLYCQWRCPLVGPRANLDALKMEQISCPCEELNHISWDVQPVANHIPQKSKYFFGLLLDLPHSSGLFLVSMPCFIFFWRCPRTGTVMKVGGLICLNVTISLQACHNYDAHIWGK